MMITRHTNVLHASPTTWETVGGGDRIVLLMGEFNPGTLLLVVVYF